MKQTLDNLTERLHELQRHFDEAFARPQDATAVTTHQLLAIRAGDFRVMLRLAEVAGIHACPKLVALPAPRPGLLGVVGVRGRVLAVYSMAALLGSPRSEATPRWLLLPRASDQMALCVDSIEAFVNVAGSALYPTSGAPEDALCPEIFNSSATTQPVLSMTRAVAAVRRSLELPIPAPAAPAAPAPKEP